MSTRGSIATLVLALAGCGPGDDAPIDCEPLQQAPLTQEAFEGCAACFGAEPESTTGTCRARVADLRVEQVRAVLAATASDRDQDKVTCDGEPEILYDNADYVVEHAAEYRTLEDLQEDVVGEPGGGLQVRISGGCDEVGNCWPGLAVFTVIEFAAAPPTCCIGSACDGAAYQCDREAASGLPTTCTSLP